MPNEPRTFKEAAAAQDPADRARLADSESFADVTVTSPFHQQVAVIEDSDATGDWRVEYFDDDVACYVTVIRRSKAEKRARNYFEALKFGRLRAVRA